MNNQDKIFEPKMASVSADVFSRYMPLHKAALKGDWESAKRFFDSDPAAVTAIITEFSETVLHIVVGTRTINATHFLKQLLKLIPLDVALETLTDGWGETALDGAAVYGNTEAAKLIVEHSPRLPNIRNGLLVVLVAYPIRCLL
ncbi:hypothetical protein L1049_022517 [Liquidambar formosana]|uniref:Ankyrin repeat protein n=1 Tax=Liquidambar formosana TaxID=63359 RepID=A0AAP0RE17_LIQFO